MCALLSEVRSRNVRRECACLLAEQSRGDRDLGAPSRPYPGGATQGSLRWPEALDRTTARRDATVPANDHVLLPGRQEHGIHGDHEWGRSGADDMV